MVIIYLTTTGLTIWAIKWLLFGKMGRPHDIISVIMAFSRVSHIYNRHQRSAKQKKIAKKFAFVEDNFVIVPSPPIPNFKNVNRKNFSLESILHWHPDSKNWIDHSALWFLPNSDRHIKWFLGSPASDHPVKIVVHFFI
jgi:hypothetical protein